MSSFDPQWIGGLALLAMALIVAAGLPIPPEWRGRFKTAAIGLFILALIAALVLIAGWAINGASR